MACHHLACYAVYWEAYFAAEPRVNHQVLEAEVRTQGLYSGNSILHYDSGSQLLHDGVGIGYSQHAGQVIVADGTLEAAQRLERVLTTDPSMGVVRHADAGYPEAIEFAKKNGIKMLMMSK